MLVQLKGIILGNGFSFLSGIEKKFIVRRNKLIIKRNKFRINRNKLIINRISARGLIKADLCLA